jgi:hypothetical protein
MKSKVLFRKDVDVQVKKAFIEKAHDGSSVLRLEMESGEVVASVSDSTFDKLMETAYVSQWKGRLGNRDVKTVSQEKVVAKTKGNSPKMKSHTRKITLNPSGKPHSWTTQERLEVLNSKKSDVELAKKLGVTAKAVKMQRYSMNKKLKAKK